MKVLMTADTVGGVWSFALELCQALAPFDIDVTLAVVGPPPTRAQHAAAVEAGAAGLHKLECRLEWMSDPWPDVATAGAWLLALADDMHADIVHLNSFAHGALPWHAPVIVTGHSCVLSWWRAVHGEEAPGEWGRYREHVGAGLRAADVVTAPTRSMLDSLEIDYGPVRRPVVVPNGIAQPALSRPRREPLVLAAGRVWDPAKNMHTLDSAAPAIRWPVAIAGADTGPDGRRCVVQRATSLGRLPAAELAQWYRRASILVHPALYEPFGLVPLEAAAHGCALVLSDIPSLREVWGDAAVFVDAHDDAGVAATVNALIGDAPRTAALAHAARTRARTLSGDAMASAYHEVYAAARSTTCIS